MDQNNESQKVVFEDEELQRPAHSFQPPPPPKIVGWVLKYLGGYIKNEKQANYLLLGFVIIAVIFTLTLFFGGEDRNIPTAAQQEQLDKIERLQNI